MNSRVTTFVVVIGAILVALVALIRMMLVSAGFSDQRDIEPPPVHSTVRVDRAEEPNLVPHVAERSQESGVARDVESQYGEVLVEVVEQETRKPREGIPVRIFLSPQPNTENFLGTFQSDVNGQIRLERAAFGRYRSEIKEFAVKACLIAELTAELPECVVTFEIQPGIIRVVGECRSGDSGDAVPGVAIGIREEFAPLDVAETLNLAITGGDGRFSLLWKVHASPSLFVLTEHEQYRATRQPVPFDVTRCDVNLGTIFLDPAETGVAGQMVDPGNNPIRQATVKASSGARSLESRTDSRGKFFIAGIDPGTWLLSVTPRCLNQQSAVSFTVPNPPRLVDVGQVIVTEGDHRLRCRLLNGEGIPIEGVSLTVGAFTMISDATGFVEFAVCGPEPQTAVASVSVQHEPGDKFTQVCPDLSVTSGMNEIVVRPRGLVFSLENEVGEPLTDEQKVTVVGKGPGSLRYAFAAARSRVRIADPIKSGEWDFDIMLNDIAFGKASVVIDSEAIRKHEVVVAVRESKNR